MKRKLYLWAIATICMHMVYAQSGSNNSSVVVTPSPDQLITETPAVCQKNTGKNIVVKVAEPGQIVTVTDPRAQRLAITTVRLPLPQEIVTTTPPACLRPGNQAGKQ